jgi:ubiquinone/menaquinone biosynthesis C-methylase UbiE
MRFGVSAEAMEPQGLFWRAKRSSGSEGSQPRENAERLSARKQGWYYSRQAPYAATFLAEVVMTTPATAPSLFAPTAFTNNFAEVYEQTLVGPLFRPWAERLLDRVPLATGARVLDVACGTGALARAVTARFEGATRVIGVDRNPAMLAVARQVAPAMDWRVGDAAALPVAPDERFDAVFCHEGLQFFPDRAAALRAMRAVLVPGGSLGVAVWRSVEENGVFYTLDHIAERFLGPIRDVRHSFADADALGELLRACGFANVKVEPVVADVRFHLRPDVLARLNCTAVLGMSAAASSMSDDEKAKMVGAIVDASVEEILPYVTDGAIISRTSANLATAVSR